MKQVGIIGAGAAGLCALKHTITKEGLSPVIWEQASALGGTWVYTNETGLDKNNLPIHSSMYCNLKTNLPKEIMGFIDYPFKVEGKSFIHHSKVLQYLNDYADHFGLRPWIKFEHLVLQVERKANEKGVVLWEVLVKNLKENSLSKVYCDGLLVCNGHYSAPKSTKIIGIENFNGWVTHSHNYRTPEPHKGHTVIILGASSSGMDLSLEVASVAKKVYLSHNFPLPIASKMPKSITQVKGIKEATEQGFILMDNSYVEVDDLILCTGYEYKFPFLAPSCGIEVVENNRVAPLYKHVIHATYPSMGFIGLVFQVVPFPLFDAQVNYFLAAFLGDILPSEVKMKLEITKSLTDGSSMKHYHLLGSRQWEYLEDLFSVMDAERPNVAFLQNIFDIVWKRRFFSLMSYKDIDYSGKVFGDGTYEINESCNGKKINTFFSLNTLILGRLLSLLIFHFIDVLKCILSKIGLKITRAMNS